MSHLDVRDSKLSCIVRDEPMAKRASGFRSPRARFGEQHDGVLIFSDIPGDRLYRFDPRSDAVDIFRTPSNKTNGNCLDREGRLVSCEHGTSRLVRQEPDGRMTTLASHYGGLELNSPNDVIVDSSGRLYFTDPPYGRYAGRACCLVWESRAPIQQPVRGVYRVDPRDGSIIRLVEDFEEPNGLCLAENGRSLRQRYGEEAHPPVRGREGRVSGGESGPSSRATSLACRTA